jgi:hypothetical protein
VIDVAVILYWVGRGGTPGRITKGGLILVGKADNEHWNVTAYALFYISPIWPKMGCVWRRVGCG